MDPLYCFTFAESVKIHLSKNITSEQLPLQLNEEISFHIMVKKRSKIGGTLQFIQKPFIAYKIYLTATSTEEFTESIDDLNFSLRKFPVNVSIATLGNFTDIVVYSCGSWLIFNLKTLYKKCFAIDHSFLPPLCKLI